MTRDDLRTLLDGAVAGDRPHVERLAVAAAVIAELLRQRGMRATLVGGGAIEIHAPGLYTTNDIDLIVEGGSRSELDEVFAALGFERRGRHWVREGLFVEVPGNTMTDPVDVVAVGSLPLRVVRREVVLADRIVGFKHWHATAYGAQAIALLALFGDTMDDAALRARLQSEDAEDALEALRDLAGTGAPVHEEELQALLQRLHRSHPSRRDES